MNGQPGTGKTAWTQAIAYEILVGLGFVIFILDHDAIENFVPPPYLEKICLIVNEADNLAQDRSSEVARQNNRTEHILACWTALCIKASRTIARFMPGNGWWC